MITHLDSVLKCSHVHKVVQLLEKYVRLCFMESVSTLVTKPVFVFNHAHDVQERNIALPTVSKFPMTGCGDWVLSCLVPGDKYWWINDFVS
jgi:hypothetical protein